MLGLFLSLDTSNYVKFWFWCWWVIVCLDLASTPPPWSGNMGNKPDASRGKWTKWVESVKTQKCRYIPTNVVSLEKHLWVKQLKFGGSKRFEVYIFHHKYNIYMTYRWYITMTFFWGGGCKPTLTMGASILPPGDAGHPSCLREQTLGSAVPGSRSGQGGGEL